MVIVSYFCAFQGTSEYIRPTYVPWLIATKYHGIFIRKFIRNVSVKESYCQPVIKHDVNQQRCNTIQMHTLEYISMLSMQTDKHI